MANFWRRVLPQSKQSFNSTGYWEDRYKTGGNSGSGSYGQLAEFKATVLNEFIKANNVQSLIEFGCGDGNQLSLAAYPNYIGLDVSSTVLVQCREKFRDDRTKSFFHYDGEAFVDNHKIFFADASLSLDVLYHLVEDRVFENYMKHLFQSASRYVIIYSSNLDKYDQAIATHERHRRFTDFVEKQFPLWQLMNTVENVHRPKDWSDEDGSIADFYFYKRRETIS